MGKGKGAGSAAAAALPDECSSWAPAGLAVHVVVDLVQRRDTLMQIYLSKRMPPESRCWGGSSRRPGSAVTGAGAVTGEAEAVTGAGAERTTSNGEQVQKRRSGGGDGEPTKQRDDDSPAIRRPEAGEGPAAQRLPRRLEPGDEGRRHCTQVCSNARSLGSPAAGSNREPPYALPSRCQRRTGEVQDLGWSTAGTSSALLGKPACHHQDPGGVAQGPRRLGRRATPLPPAAAGWPRAAREHRRG